MEEYICDYYDNEKGDELTDDELREEFYDEWFQYIDEFYN